MAQYAKIDGLYPREEIILQVLSNKAGKTLAEVARLSDLPRSTAQYNLYRLTKKKLALTEKQGKRTLYRRGNVQLQKKSIVSSPITNAGGVTIYRGAKAMAVLWHEMVSLPEGSRLVGMQPRKSFNEAVKRSNKIDVHDVSKLIRDKKYIMDCIIHEKGILSVFDVFEGKDADRIAEVFTKRLEDITKVPNEFLDEKAEWFSIGDTTVFMDWFSEVGVKITDRNINNFMRSIYSATKAYGERFHQGKYIEDILEKKMK